MSEHPDTVIPAAPGFNQLSVWLEPHNVPATTEVIERRMEVSPVVAWLVQGYNVGPLDPWWDSPDGLALQCEFEREIERGTDDLYIAGTEYPDGRVLAHGMEPFADRAAFVQHAVAQLRARQQRLAVAA